MYNINMSEFASQLASEFASTESILLMLAIIFLILTNPNKKEQ